MSASRLLHRHNGFLDLDWIHEVSRRTHNVGLQSAQQEVRSSHEDSVTHTLTLVSKLRLHKIFPLFLRRASPVTLQISDTQVHCALSVTILMTWYGNCNCTTKCK